LRLNDFSAGMLLKTAVILLLGTAIAYADTSTAVHHTQKHKSHKHVAKSHGQKKIDRQRAEQIQQALIREHYLSGEASGVWDDASQRAMERYQASNGWQTKEVPDSRALIKLGLGPDHEHLLNPESAMTTPPQLSPRTSAAEPTSSQHQK
jgi:hypothetical protein